MGENICKPFVQEGVNIQNIKRPPTPQQQINKQKNNLHEKMGKGFFIKKVK